MKKTKGLIIFLSILFLISTYSTVLAGKPVKPPKPPREKSGNIKISVSDGTSAIIGAYVQVGAESGYTDTSGALSLRLTYGTYDWIATKTNYFDETGTIEHKDKNTDLNIVMSSTPPEYFDLTISVQGVGVGYTEPSVGTYTYLEDETVVVQAYQNPSNSFFQYWLIDGNIVGTTVTHSIVMDQHHTITAVYSDTPPPPTPPVVLYTQNTKIMRDGTQFNLYGMDVDHHPLKKTSSSSDANSPDETLFTQEDIDYYKQNGFNLVTFHQIWLDEMTDGDGNINEGFFENWVDVWVQWAFEREIYCIIGMSDLHVTNINWGVYTMPSWVSDDYGGSPSGKNWREEMREIIHGFYGMDERSQDEREVYYDLWKFIANRYKDNPYVMYGPTNEPLHHTWQDFYPSESYWHDLATAYSNTMTNVIDHIREGEVGGFEKIVFIDRPYFEDSEFMNYVKPINRPNIVWEYHDFGGTSDWNTLNNWKIGVENIRDFFHALDKPVHLGEWSVANTISEFWQMDDWKNFHLEQSKWIEQMDVSHSWYHYASLEGEYWNLVRERNGEQVLTQEDSEYIIQTLKDYSR